MSDNYDDRPSASGANLAGGQQGRTGDPTLRDRAGADLQADYRGAGGLHQEFAEEIGGLSQEGRQEVDDIIRAHDYRKDQELRDQKRSRKFRQISEENRRYQELLRHPELKVGEMPMNAQGEIDHIQESAKAHVAERERGYLERIERDAKYSVSRAIRADQERQRGVSGPAHGQNQNLANRAPDHDQEPEH